MTVHFIQQLIEIQRSKLVCSGVPSVIRAYTKGLPFLSRMVSKRVRVVPRGGALHHKILLSTPPGIRTLDYANCFLVFLPVFNNFFRHGINLNHSGANDA